MIDPVTLVNDGGPLAFVILAGAFGGLLWAVLATLLRLAVRVPGLVHLLVPAGLLGAGVVGTFQGLAMTVAAVQMASFEVQPTLAAHGMAVSLYTIVLALYLAPLLLSLSALALGAIGLWGRRPSLRATSLVGW